MDVLLIGFGTWCLLLGVAELVAALLTLGGDIKSLLGRISGRVRYASIRRA